MNDTGIDYHKRYSVACTLDGQGRLVKQARIGTPRTDYPAQR